jgi:hypothetical protein
VHGRAGEPEGSDKPEDADKPGNTDKPGSADKPDGTEQPGDADAPEEAPDWEAPGKAGGLWIGLGAGLLAGALLLCWLALRKRGKDPEKKNDAP